MDFNLRNDHYTADGFKGRYVIGDHGGGKASIRTPDGEYHKVPWDVHKEWLVAWDVS